MLTVAFIAIATFVVSLAGLTAALGLPLALLSAPFVSSAVGAVAALAMAAAEPRVVDGEDRFDDALAGSGASVRRAGAEPPSAAPRQTRRSSRDLPRG